MIDLSASVRQKIGELLAKSSSPHGQLRGGRQGNVTRSSICSFFESGPGGDEPS